MPLYEHLILKVDLVLVGVGLLLEPLQVDAFSALADGEVVPTGVGLALTETQKTPEPATRLELPRDRITLELSAGRSVIERAYPSASDLSRFADVVTLAVDKSELGSAVPTSHGYNLEMVYRQESGENAYRYLGQRLFPGDAFADQGWSPAGGAGKLAYESLDGRWECIVEPRFRARDTDKVFLLLNLHKEQSAMPSREEIVTFLELVLNQAYALADRIDAGAHS